VVALLIIIATIDVLVYILSNYIINTRVIDTFRTSQYFINITRFFGGERCVWVHSAPKLETNEPMEVYSLPSYQSSVNHKIGYPVMVVYRG